MCTGRQPGRTSKMVQWLVDHPVDCITLFSEDKSTPHSQGQPSGSNKQEIYGVIKKIVFDGDPEYGGLFMLQPAKFSEVAKKFKQTGNGIATAGISEGDPEYNNLLESVLEAFPWYMDLHGLWKGIPSISLKAVINSTPGISYGTQLLSIVKKISTATASDSPSEPPMSNHHTHTANEPSQEPLAHPDLNGPPAHNVVLGYHRIWTAEVDKSPYQMGQLIVG
ncbi:hypothetical protein PAXRUDRAFT_172158 [Paxillus rubicundulus Ve08.2h10]|uniref:Uncharacterized protein n=1 Tax=Paxillus rubicundulus Ve08.2h10 TaxID=930991 RepID=A0A0D0D6A0_9AGAM|nr:hypothetical protein PAXRUDRAFT_172158 [Paxillus rubicundulus Ve08.2h10]